MPRALTAETIDPEIERSSLQLYGVTRTRPNETSLPPGLLLPLNLSGRRGVVTNALTTNPQRQFPSTNIMPTNKERFNLDIPSCLTIGKRSGASSSHPSLYHNEHGVIGSSDKTVNMPIYTIGPARQGSSGSSTSQSSQSETSRKSRPSSRSSVDEAAAAPSKSVGSLSTNERRTRPVARKPYAILPYPTTDDVLWSNQKSINKTHQAVCPSGRNKPLPADPSNDLTEIRTRLWDGMTLGNARLSTPDLPKSKRGARLGKTMLATAHGSRAQPLTSLIISAASARPPYDRKDSSSDIGQSADEKGHKVPGRGTRGVSVVTSDAAERVILNILSNLSTLDDLRSAAMVSKGFHRVFRRYERDLVSRILFRSSAPAWELRQIMKCEQKRSAFKLRSIQRDIATVQALQSFIVMRCEHICRPATFDALTGLNCTRKAELDNAIWRIWTFCKLFGKNRGKDNDARNQTLWLDGGRRSKKASTVVSLGIGNGPGLSIGELEDLSEMWRCLEELISGFRGQEIEAGRAGVFDACSERLQAGVTKSALLDAWIYDILSLGPKAVLTLSSCSFDQAKVLGVTKWSPPAEGQSRANFLKGAVEEVYRERLVTNARAKATAFEKTIKSTAKPRRADSAAAAETSTLSAAPSQDLRRVTTLPLHNPGNVNKPLPKPLPRPRSKVQSKPEPIEIRPDCDPTGAPSVSPAILPISPASNVTAFTCLAMTPTASTRVGASLFPANNSAARAAAVPLHRQLSDIAESPEIHMKIQDPADEALILLVDRMRFPRAHAQRALAMSDNGQGHDVKRAIEILTSTQVPAPVKRPCQLTELPVPGLVCPPSQPETKLSTAVQLSNSSPSRHTQVHGREARKTTSLGAIADKPNIRRRTSRGKQVRSLPSTPSLQQGMRRISITEKVRNGFRSHYSGRRPSDHEMARTAKAPIPFAPPRSRSLPTSSIQLPNGTVWIPVGPGSGKIDENGHALSSGRETDYQVLQILEPGLAATSITTTLNTGNRLRKSRLSRST